MWNPLGTNLAHIPNAKLMDVVKRLAVPIFQDCWNQFWLDLQAFVAILSEHFLDCKGC